MLYHFPRLAPRRPAKSKKSVQSTFREDTPVLKLRHSEMTEFLENRQIEHEVANRDTNTRPVARRLEDTKRKILDRKMRIRQNFDERFQRGWHALKPSH